MRRRGGGATVATGWRTHRTPPGSWCAAAPPTSAPRLPPCKGGDNTPIASDSTCASGGGAPVATGVMISSSGLGLAEASCADSTAVPSLPTTSCPAVSNAMSRLRDFSLSASLSSRAWPSCTFSCASCSSRSARAARSSCASRASLALSARASARLFSEAESFASSDLLSSTVLARLPSSALIASSLMLAVDAMAMLVVDCDGRLYTSSLMAARRATARHACVTLKFRWEEVT